MSFYDDWEKAIETNDTAEDYIIRFLDFSPDSVSVFEDGEKADVLTAIKLLLSIPISSFIDGITHPYDFTTKEVFQYSKLEDATDTLCNILEYEEFTLSYEEAGQRLVHAPNQYANIKYGENHSKTAALLSLVVIRPIPERRCNMVRISSLGSVMTLLSKDEKEEVLRRLAIRNPFMKTLIYQAKCGEASYVKEVSKVLSGQTIVRRKHNNEIVMNMILKDDPLKDRIRWQ